MKSATGGEWWYVQSNVLPEFLRVVQELLEKYTGHCFLHRIVLVDCARVEVLPNRASIAPPALTVWDQPEDPVITSPAICSLHKERHWIKEHGTYRWTMGVVGRSEVFVVRFSRNSLIASALPRTTVLWPRASRYTTFPGKYEHSLESVRKSKSEDTHRTLCTDL